MEQKQQFNINISLPNLVNVCVDEVAGGEIVGRLYHCYSAEPVAFSNVIELLKEMEELFDKIRFPQASTRSRCFREKGTAEPVAFLKRPEKLVEQHEIVERRGAKASFVVGVRFRQNATWQGEYVKLESGSGARFANTLDFLKMLDMELK